MLPDQSGTYLLILRLQDISTVEVGRLGAFRFSAGWYAYAGSARGPGGLAARVSRHLREHKSLHWHVDYLRTCASPVAVWYALGSRKRECVWAQAILNLPGASVPAPRFGASDCDCLAHLIYFHALPDVKTFARAVGETIIEKAVI